jgi:hypothetical protein
MDEQVHPSRCEEPLREAGVRVVSPGRPGLRGPGIAGQGGMGKHGPAASGVPTAFGPRGLGLVATS